MSLFNSYDRTKQFAELADPLDTQEGVLSPAVQRARALKNLGLGTSATSPVTAGTVAASQVVVVDSNKDIGDFRNLDAVNFDAGSSGVAGTVDVFASTAASGKIRLAAADSAGDYTLTITNASLAAARTVTIPDPGANASFVMTAGTQTVGGAKTYTGGPVFTTTNIGITDVDVVLGTTTGSKLGTLASQKLGFWGSTPIVQPATTGTSSGFTAGAGTAVKDDSTFTGGSGSKAYRISDIVLALKAAGIMAAS